MYIDDETYQRDGTTYRRVLLRRGKRISPQKTKLYTIANLSSYPDEEIEALKIALNNKGKIPYLHNLSKGNVYNGKIYGAIICLYQVSQQLGISNIFGNRNIYASLNLWLIFARFLGNGSRLSAVRQAQIHAGCEILGIESLTEDDLYSAMDWLYDHKSEIEKKLFSNWKKLPKNRISTNHVFLYDLSSSYLEGTENELAAFGYNRDQKKGKMIITYGLLTDVDGDPLGIEVFPGNTSDNKTVKTQIEKIKQEYQSQYITFVGDKGMIKNGEQKLISGEDDFYYITSITKAQINTLLSKKFINLGLFDEKLCEVEDIEETIRYILRRNPIRAEEIQLSRESKMASIRKAITQSNTYLSEHPKSKVEVQIRDITAYIKKLKLVDALKVEQESDGARKLKLEIDTQELLELSKLDGCYAIKTDLPKNVLDTEQVHARYKDLALVEQAFKEVKSLLNARGIFVRKKERTIAHMVTTMFSYKIERYLRNVWKEIDLTPMEGIEMLKQLGSQIIQIGKTKQITIPKPTGLCEKLLDKINVIMPNVLPYKVADVHTNRKLVNRRK